MRPSVLTLGAPQTGYATWYWRSVHSNDPICCWPFGSASRPLITISPFAQNAANKQPNSGLLGQCPLSLQSRYLTSCTYTYRPFTCLNMPAPDCPLTFYPFRLPISCPTRFYCERPKLSAKGPVCQHFVLQHLKLCLKFVLSDCLSGPQVPYKCFKSCLPAIMQGLCIPAGIPASPFHPTSGEVLFTFMPWGIVYCSSQR